MCFKILFLIIRIGGSSLLFWSYEIWSIFHLSSTIQTKLNEIENINVEFASVVFINLLHSYFGHHIFKKPLISKAKRCYQCEEGSGSN